MKQKRYCVFVAVLLLCSFIFANDFSTDKGVDYSDTVYSFLKKSHYFPKTQNLVASGENNFPYNIFITFSQEYKSESSENTDTEFLFVFKQEELHENKEIVKTVINYFAKNIPGQKTTILFSYGDTPQIQNHYSISGTQVYLASLNDVKNLNIIFFEFTDKRNFIVSNGNGRTAPSYMIQSIYNTILKSNIRFYIPALYLSQLHTYEISLDNQVKSILSQEIPCIKLGINPSMNTPEEISNFIINTTNNVIENVNNKFDQHFLLLRIFGKYYFNISEKAIIISIIFIILFFLIYLFINFYISNRIKKIEWTRLKKIWYAIPALFAIIFLSLFLGKVFGYIIPKNKSTLYKTILTITLQTNFSIIFISLFNLFESLFNKKLEPKSVDYLIILSTFLNQFIFTFVDISLFPIFLIFCVIAIFSQFINNRYIKIIFLLLMIFPFVIYAKSFLQILFKSNLDTSFIFSFKLFIFISLIFYPIFLFIFRVFSDFYKIHQSKSRATLITISLNVILCTSISIYAVCYYKHIRKVENKNQIEITKITEENDLVANNIKLDYKDKKVIENTVRTIYITLPSNITHCDISVTSNRGNPILYSDNSYIQISNKVAKFLIPDFPPENLTFSYGIIAAESTIKVTAYIKDSKNEFKRFEKSFIIE